MNAAEGALLKIERAEQRLTDLERAIAAYATRENRSMVRQAESRTGEFVYALQIKREPPDDLALMLGEFAYNLRAGLDYLVWGLSATPEEKPYPEFPIFDDEGLFRKEGRRKIARISTPARYMIIGHQPFQQGKAAKRHPLWLLSKARNTDQHRHVLPQVQVGGALFGPASAGLPGLSAAIIGASQYDNSKPISLELPDSGSEIDLPPAIIVQIRFDIGEGIPLDVGALDQVYRYVRADVYSDLSRFFP